MRTAMALLLMAFTHINLDQYIPLAWSSHGADLGSFLGISEVFLKLFLPTFPFFIIRCKNAQKYIVNLI